MSFLETVDRARTFLERHRRVSLRALRREFDLDAETLAELSDELVQVQRVAVLEGDVLVWAGAETRTVPPTGIPPPTTDPRSYTPKHLAEKILTTRSALEGERKQVTVLFADVKGSMDLAEQVDPEEWHKIMDQFFAILSEGVHRFEGTINQYTGDGIMALFGAPIAHEDHAQRACYAALHLQGEIARYATEVKREHGLGFSTRMGLHSGEVVVGKIGDDLRMDYTAQGHTVGLAQRMESLAEPNTCYLTGATAALVGGYFALDDLGEFRVKGIATPVRVHRLAGAGTSRTRFDVARSRGLSRFVGRGADLRTLEDALEQTGAGNGQVVGVVAEAGTGKSRLCFEFLERCRARGMRVYEGRAVAHGRNIPFLPILEVFRAYFGITLGDDDRSAREKIAGRMVVLDQKFAEALPLLFDFLGVADPQRPAPRLDPEARQRQLIGVMRQLIQSVSEAQPTVTLIEDLHWLDGASGEFLEHMVDARAGSHNLLVVNFRPEYRAEWMQKSWYRQIPLTPLGREAIAELLADLLGDDPSIAALAGPIHTRTGGNPFFTEEITQSLIESGQLEGERGAYRLVTPVERLEVPATVQAVLAARIDRLPEREKRLLQVASVIGKDFAEPLLAVVAELPNDELKASLAALRRAEFLHEQSIYPVVEYSFKHPLTQEVALGSQLRERRRRVHAAVARAIEQQDAEHLDERAAEIAHHYEDAGDAAAAARWHRRAAEWAGLNDMRAALHHWQRVRELARHAGDAAESDALTAVACSHALTLGWRLGPSATGWGELFEEGCAAAERAGDLPALVMLNATYGAVCSNNQANARDDLRYGGEAVRIADRSGDAALRCATHGNRCITHAWAGQLQESERVADEAIELAREDPHLGVEVMGFSPLLAARWMRHRCIGFTRDPEAALRELPLARQVALDSGYPEQALWMLWGEAELRWAFGSSGGARALAQAAARLAENLGIGNQMLVALTLCDTLACDREWRPLLDAASDALRLTRERGVMRLLEPTLLAHIGTAELELGNLDAGRAAAEGGVAFMRTSKSAWNPHSYAVLARAQFELHELAADITRTLDEYAALLEHTGFHLYEGELHELRARLADREGHETEKAAALERARDCYTRFGMTAQASRVVALAEHSP